ncbi:MAG: M14 family zinc carboxypeptidase, partial [Oscillospiraceae bacterium]
MITDFYHEKFSYENSVDKIYGLKKQYDVSPEIVGKSFLGRKIFAIPLGKNPNNILYVGTVHGMEWITSHILFRFCEDILDAQVNNKTLFGIEIAKMLSTRGAYIIPFLNPDGAQLQSHGKSAALHYSDDLGKMCGGDFSHWQANARGVDLNHNFDAGFDILKKMEQDEGILSPCPSRYGGKFPNSEPETKAIVNFIMKKN